MLKTLAESVLDNDNYCAFYTEIKLSNNIFAHFCGNVETDSCYEDDSLGGYDNGTWALTTTYDLVSISNMELCTYGDGDDKIPCETEEYMMIR